MIRQQLEQIEESFASGKNDVCDIWRLCEYIRQLHAAIWAHRDEIMRLTKNGTVGDVHRRLWDLVENHRRLGE